MRRDQMTKPTSYPGSGFLVSFDANFWDGGMMAEPMVATLAGRPRFRLNLPAARQLLGKFPHLLLNRCLGLDDAFS